MLLNITTASAEISGVRTGPTDWLKYWITVSSARTVTVNSFNGRWRNVICQCSICTPEIYTVSAGVWVSVVAELPLMNSFHAIFMPSRFWIWWRFHVTLCYSGCSADFFSCSNGPRTVTTNVLSHYSHFEKIIPHFSCLLPFWYILLNTYCKFYKLYLQFSTCFIQYTSCSRNYQQV